LKKKVQVKSFKCNLLQIIFYELEEEGEPQVLGPQNWNLQHSHLQNQPQNLPQILLQIHHHLQKVQILHHKLHIAQQLEQAVSNLIQLIPSYPQLFFLVH